MLNIRRHIFFFVLSLFSVSSWAENILYEYDGWLIRGGKYGPIMNFQVAASAYLKTCNSQTSLSPDGIFGNDTKKAIIALTSCNSIQQKLPTNSLAYKGILTDSLWEIILPDLVVPSADQRARSVKLTFEATDYDKMQWNYCQNKPFYHPDSGVTQCKSNDKRSYITWGPNGATAGHGREVQMIISTFLDNKNPDRLALLQQAFLGESDAVLRMLDMNKPNSDKINGALETYLCSVWTDKKRRIAWQQGFNRLGDIHEVRQTYNDVYHSRSFDGGKIKSFYDVWQDPEFALAVTELDHAFFVDRSAHMGIIKKDMFKEMQRLKEKHIQQWPLPAAQIRRHIALQVIPPNQRKDRMGRDVAFYIDGIGFENIEAIEQNNWRERGKIKAGNVGLGDKKLMPAYIPGEHIKFPMPDGQTNSNETCPAEVLNPI